MEKLVQYLNNFIHLTNNDFLLLQKLCILKKVDKRTILLQEGKTAEKLYFIEEGLLCAKINRDGKNIINWFAYENHFVTSMYSFISQKSSYESIETLENCIIYEITYENLQLLYQQTPAFEKLGRILTEQYYIQLEERALSLQYLSAIEKYHQFVQTEPLLFQRISLGQLSSYLGISQETLSRIRGKT